MLLGGIVLYIGLRLADTASVSSDVGLSVCGDVLCGSLCLWCRRCVSLPVVSPSLPSSPLRLVMAASLVPAQWVSLFLISCFWASSMKIDGLGAKVRGDILGRGFLQYFFFLLISITSIPQIRHHIAFLC